MRRTEDELDDLLDRHLAFFKASSHPQADATREAALQRLRTRAAASIDVTEAQPLRPPRRLTFYAAAAAVFVVLLLLILFRPVREKVPLSPREGESLAARQGAPARFAFEIISIRPNATPGRGRGGPAALLVRCGRPFLRIQVDPGRFIASASVYDLIALAYGKDCLSTTGGPDWASSEVFVIQAVIPAGSPSYTAAQLRNADAPELQSMIQKLLADRFNIAMHRETRETPVYNLVVVKSGKLKPAGAPDPNEPPRRRIPTMGSADTTLRRFADGLAGQLERPVLDKTGLKDSYRIVLEFPELASDAPIRPDGNPLRMRDLIPEKLEDQLGLKLQPARAPLEILVIDSLDRPTEN